ncbi:MAG TPA: hypothetical protein VKR81_14945 [Candidatus Binatia bacterium]|nr:hypothetical protein [Candidatus Binatia bacterium]
MAGKKLTNMIWDIVEPTDSGMLEELSRRGLRDGEQRLMLALLESATEDFQKYVLANGKRSQELFQEAEDWILETGSPSFFSFENVCEHLHLDPTYIRKGLMRWKAAKLDTQVQRSADHSLRRA